MWSPKYCGVKTIKNSCISAGEQMFAETILNLKWEEIKLKNVKHELWNEFAQTHSTHTTFCLLFLMYDCLSQSLEMGRIKLKSTT